MDVHSISCRINRRGIGANFLDVGTRMMSSNRPLVVVGSINIDLVVTAPRIPMVGETIQGDSFQQHFGGKGANQAVAAARLGYPVEMIGMVGADSLGEQARASLRTHGVGVDAVGTAAGSSGIASITVSRGGENSIVITPGANAHMTKEHLDRHVSRIKSAGFVLAQLEIPLPAVLYLIELCRHYAVPLILDPAPAQPLPCEAMSGVAWFTPNETEAGFYAGQMDSGVSVADPVRQAQVFLQAGAQAVALKLGAQGVLLASNKLSPLLLPGMAVKAVDTTAAGDAFNGAFATGLMLGMDPTGAARFACAAAAVSVTRRGAQPSMPSREEVDAALSTQK